LMNVVVLWTGLVLAASISQMIMATMLTHIYVNYVDAGQATA
jgi:hypothetical protein